MIVFLTFRQPTSVFAIFACLGQRELQRKVLAKMCGEQWIAALLALETCDAPIQGSADQPADPIDGGFDVRDQRIGVYAH